MMGTVKAAKVGVAIITCSMWFPALTNAQGQTPSTSAGTTTGDVQQLRASGYARRYADEILTGAGAVGSVWTIEAWLGGTGNLTDQKLISASRIIAEIIDDGVVHREKMEQLSGLLPDCSSRMAMGLGFDPEELDAAIASRRLVSRNAILAMIETSRTKYTHQFQQADDEPVSAPSIAQDGGERDALARAADEAAAAADSVVGDIE